MSADGGSVLVIAAPSGVGKSTLVGRVLERVPDLSFSVSYTTRAPRPDEVDGTDYRFVARDEFERVKAEGGLLEWAVVHGEHYGTSRSDVEATLRQGVDVLLDIDVQGAAQVKQRMPEASFVFVLPPDYATLESRLRGRRTESASSLARRLGNAAREIRAFDLFDYLVVNDDLERATSEIVAILTASRCRTARRRRTASRIVATFPEPGQDGWER